MYSVDLVLNTIILFFMLFYIINLIAFVMEEKNENSKIIRLLRIANYYIDNEEEFESDNQKFEEMYKIKFCKNCFLEYDVCLARKNTIYCFGEIYK